MAKIGSEDDKKILKIMKHLHTFNKLHAREVFMLSEVYNTNALAIATDNGIIFDMDENWHITRDGFLEPGYG